jgi:hypothetical protein
MKKLFILTILVTLLACEDPVTVETNNGRVQVVVDALLTVEQKDQLIYLSRSGSYVDIFSGSLITDANVQITDDLGKEYNFNYDENRFAYVLDSAEVDFNVDRTYALSVFADGKEFTSTSSIREVPAIDSIVWKEEDFFLTVLDVQFYAVDLEGLGDFYYPRAYRNGERYNQTDFSLGWDASPAPGSEFDNEVLAQPIRDVLQIVNEDNLSDEEFRDTYLGDTLEVELLSISEGLNYHLDILNGEISNGGLFATPPANVPTNIVVEGEEALGWFEICNVSRDRAILNSTEGNNRLE